MSGVFRLDPDVLLTTTSQYQALIDGMTQRYALIARQAEEIYGTSWAGEAAKSQQELFDEWSRSFTDIMQNLQTMKENLYQAHTDLTTTEQNNATQITSGFTFSGLTTLVTDPEQSASPSTD